MTIPEFVNVFAQEVERRPSVRFRVTADGELRCGKRCPIEFVAKGRGNSVLLYTCLDIGLSATDGQIIAMAADNRLEESDFEPHLRQQLLQAAGIQEVGAR